MQPPNPPPYTQDLQFFIRKPLTGELGAEAGGRDGAVGIPCDGAGVTGAKPKP